MSVLLYESETWNMHEQDNKKLDTFHFTRLRRILQIRWPYVISNEELLSKTNLKRISQEVKEKRWKWIGHVLRMNDGNHCVTALSWAPEGKRKVGRPRTTWRRTVERERKDMGWSSWSQVRTIAKDRGCWRDSLTALWATGPKEDR